jgi:hypothetical protein
MPADGCRPRLGVCQLGAARIARSGSAPLAHAAEVDDSPLTRMSLPGTIAPAVDSVARGRHPASTESAADERSVVRTRCLPASHPPRRCPRKRSLPDRKPAFAASVRAASWRPGR